MSTLNRLALPASPSLFASLEEGLKHKQARDLGTVYFFVPPDEVPNGLEPGQICVVYDWFYVLSQIEYTPLGCKLTFDLKRR